MSQLLNEGELEFDFSDDWLVFKYDKCAYYRRHFQDFANGTKAVDFVAYHQATKVLWLIEVKDYSEHSRTKPSEVVDEVAVKVRDTLAGLLAMRVRATDGSQAIAAQAMQFRSLRVALLIEQPAHHSATRIFNPMTIKDQMSRVLRPVDPHALGGDRQALAAHLPCTVRRIP